MCDLHVTISPRGEIVVDARSAELLAAFGEPRELRCGDHRRANAARPSGAAEAGLMLRVYGIEHESVVNGPVGPTSVVFVQGCPLACKGCQNRPLWEPAGGQLMTPSQVVHQLLDPRFERRAVTFSGGEPMQQAAGLIPVAEGVKAAGLVLQVYSGYTLEELNQRADESIDALLGLADILVDGRYNQSLAAGEHPFRGSSNQHIIDLAARRASRCV